MAPEYIEFRHAARGKPALKETGSPGIEAAKLKFNLSHSHELALYAITQSREVGIDIEHMRPMPDAAQIVERFFSLQERRTFHALPPEQQNEAFFTCWTRKEAFIKAKGEGLYHPLDQFSVSLVPGESARLLHVEKEPLEITHWSLRALTPTPGYVAALAVEGHSWQLRCWRIRDSKISKLF
jgi:4'-phosphopantetheinyl transferase